jgi:hypothetical protein
VTFVVNGINQNVPSPVAVTYTLNADCTGTYTVQAGPHFNIFVALDGDSLTVIDTDPGVAISEGPDFRVQSSRRGWCRSGLVSRSPASLDGIAGFHGGRLFAVMCHVENYLAQHVEDYL